ncbi:MAG: polyprenyl synthetase family protein [Megasphaera sp.]|nr:polyprenyl synthetase family protein [Megasphaera sp.]MCH4218577.1 polyprenyl synthetase family protein [Megasphaera sp.]
MIKQNLLENSTRRFIPKYFANISDDHIDKIKEYLELYMRHAFPGSSATAAVLEDATSSRGKMIRPRLLMMASAYGPDYREARERLYKLAAITEMTHLASLIHDDVVDDAPFRRGKPSVQGKYGKNAAIYAGDFLMSRLCYYCMREGLNESGMVLAKAVEDMCGGEIGQAMCRYKTDVTMDEYLRNIHGKTVALFKACCKIGAMESGCDETVIRTLETFGECLGYMFQMRDDLLDFSTDSKALGKKAHQDFREGIYTLPVLLALAQPGGRDKLQPFMDKSEAGTLTGEDIRLMERHVTALGGMEGAWNIIHAYQSHAEDLIRSLQANDVSSSLLKLIRKLGVA